MKGKKKNTGKKTTGPYAATGGFLTGIYPRLFGKKDRASGISIVRDD